MSPLLLLCLIGAPVGQKVDTLVVCPQEFRQALAPWLKYREGQGHHLAVISNLKSQTELRAEVRRVAAGGSLKYLLLIGDADPAMSHRAELRKRCVPTHHAAAVVNVRFGSENEIATDNWYADLDDDRVPDLAVGRLTCDSAAELSQLVERILAYETSTDFGAWRRSIHFVAGLGGFGAVADAVLEAAAKTLITGGVPAPYTTTMTYGSWQSPYCPDPREFKNVTIDRLNEGSLFWVYIGHGHQQAVDNVHVPGAQFPIFSSKDAGALSCRHGAPIACFLACYAGAFDQPKDCLAEEMLRSPGGPVAIICGSRMTMPYAMAVMGSELLHECFGSKPETIGEAIVSAKRSMMREPSAAGQRATLDALGKAFSPSGDDLAAERAEHLDLFNLIGDPLLRLPYPHEATLDVAPTVVAGGRIKIEGRSPVDGPCAVELVVRRDRLTFQPPRRGKFDLNAVGEYAAVYEKANEPRSAHAAVDLVDGRFATQLDVPSGARGARHVRVFIEGAKGCAAGAADVRVDAPDRPAARP